MCYTSRTVYSLNSQDTAEQNLKDRVQARVLERVSYEDECWIYTGSWLASGRAKITISTNGRGKRYWAARVAAWLWLGLDLWDSRCVVLSCHSPACVNPDHLRIVPNQRAANELLRQKIGHTPNSRAGRRLNRREAERIRAFREANPNVTIGQLALQERVGERAISDILRGRSYR